jgi:dTDP-4-dehydrorhamnose 3,5-epimerase
LVRGEELRDIYSGELEDLHLYAPKVYEDDRGWFKENWKKNSEPYNQFDFVQENVSSSNAGVLRGLHFQHPTGQGKLVTVLNGSVLDVIIDLRKDSSTYMNTDTVFLSHKNGYQLYVPDGYGHGFLSLEDNTIFHYKCTELYDPKNEYTLQWDNEITKDMWFTVSRSFPNVIVSEKDQNGLSLAEVDKLV